MAAVERASPETELNEVDRRETLSEIFDNGNEKNVSDTRVVWFHFLTKSFDSEN